MTISNHIHLGVFIVASLRLFSSIIFIRRFIINYPQNQIIILRGVIDELDEVIRELLGDEGVLFILLLPHGRVSDSHTSYINSFPPFNIVRVYGVYDTIIIILEMEAPILLQDFCLDFWYFSLWKIDANISRCSHGIPSQDEATYIQYSHQEINQGILEKYSSHRCNPYCKSLQQPWNLQKDGLFLKEFNFSSVPIAWSQVGK